jgi:hypothetical protein
MAKNINIYIISTEELKNRITNINNVVAIFKNLCAKNNIQAFINLISEPSSSTVDKNISVFNSRVDYSAFKDNNEYNEDITMLKSFSKSFFSHRALKAAKTDGESTFKSH